MNPATLPGLLLPALASACAAGAAWNDLHPLALPRDGALATKAATLCRAEPIDCTGAVSALRFHSERRVRFAEVVFTTRRALDTATQTRLRQQLGPAARQDGQRRLFVRFDVEGPPAHEAIQPPKPKGQPS